MSYVIQPGDSLWSIAARFGVSVQAIAAANQITDPNRLYVGQTLFIPTNQVNGDDRLGRLEREYSQVVTIIDQHRRQMADLSRRLRRLEEQTP